jgi:hypothetical protein
MKRKIYTRKLLVDCHLLQAAILKLSCDIAGAPTTEEDMEELRAAFARLSRSVQAYLKQDSE